MGSPAAQHVLIAPDKFKGSATAAEVAAHLAAGIRRAAPHVRVTPLPVADGGDGTVDAAVASGFTRRELTVAGPLGNPVRAAFALREDTAVVEMAEELSNTPTVCRTSYVHDAVITAFEAGALKNTKKSKSPVAQAELLARIVARHAG